MVPDLAPFSAFLQVVAGRGEGERESHDCVENWIGVMPRCHAALSSALFKQEWLNCFAEPPKPQQIKAIIQSWDTAYDIQEHHDYSVCSTWAVSGKRYFLLDIFRERLEFHALEKAVYALRDKWGADLVIVEKAGSGTSIFQNIRQATQKAWIVTMQPEGSKQHRASQQTPKFERGEVWVPEKAQWLKAFLDDAFAT